MDATAMALMQPFRSLSSSYSAAPSSSSKELRNPFGSFLMGRRRRVSEIISSGFCDEGHLRYYYNSKSRCSSSCSAGRMTVMSGKQEKREAKDKPLKKMNKKKQLKLLKGLTRDLSTFSQIGFGLDSDGGALLDQVKGNMISEAAERLLEQLQKIRAEEKESKRKMKEEKARLKAAARMQNSVNCEMSCGTSSSESSDSECGEVVDMSKLNKLTNTTQIGLQQVIEEAPSTYPAPIIPTVTSPLPVQKMDLQLSSSSNVDAKTENLGKTGPPSSSSKKIEVCMGGKCKKSGGGALLEEFQRAVGIEGVVVSGCRCMGKCRVGPNVKVLDGGVGDNRGRAPVNSLCIGVGLEDVNMIVANFLGENHNQLGFAGANLLGG